MITQLSNENIVEQCHKYAQNDEYVVTREMLTFAANRIEELENQIAQMVANKLESL